MQVKGVVIHIFYVVIHKFPGRYF